MFNQDKDGNVEIKTTIRVSKNVLKLLKKTAIDEDATISKLISKLIHEYVNRKQRK